MSVITLNEAIQDETGALAGLVCLGWEEVRAYLEVGESLDTPIVLMVGPGARASMPLAIWGEMLRKAAEASSGRFVLHLDHGREIAEVQSALDAGFSSVMYDGSALPLAENIANTNAMVKLAEQYGASTEGEIGFVGYENGAHSEGTRFNEAQSFARDAGVEFMAVSVGNVHLQTKSKAEIRWDELAELSKLGVNLVIHGGSGVKRSDRLRMVREFNVRKFNIGTEIRQIFGAALRDHLTQNPEVFDHLNILKSVHDPIMREAREIVEELWRLT